MNFETFQETFRAACVSGLRLSVPAFKDGHVSWEDSPSTFGGTNGEIKLSLVGELRSEAGVRKIKTPGRNALAGKQEIEQRTPYLATVQVESRYPSAAKALDMAGRMRDAFTREEMRALLAPIVLTWEPGPVRNVPVYASGRREPRWLFEVKVRVEIDYVLEQGKQALGTITTVEMTADLGPEVEPLEVRAQSPS